MSLYERDKALSRCFNIESEACEIEEPKELEKPIDVLKRTVKLINRKPTKKLSSAKIYKEGKKSFLDFLTLYYSPSFDSNKL